MANLHTLTGEYLALQHALESEDDAAVTDALARIGDVEDALERKHLGVVFVLRNQESDLAELKAEHARLAARIKSSEARIDGLERYMLTAMQVAKIEKIKGPTVTISRVKNPPSVIIDDESLIPLEYMVTPPPAPPPVARPDKAKIAAAFKLHGEVVPGTRVERGERLAIK